MEVPANSEKSIKDPKTSLTNIHVATETFCHVWILGDHWEWAAPLEQDH